MLSIRSAEASMRGAEVREVGLAADQHERADTLGPLERELERDRRAERVPHDDRPLEPEAVEHGCEVGRPARERELRALELARAAGAAQVDADERVARPSASQTRFQSAPESPSPCTSTTGGPSPSTSTWSSAPSTSSSCPAAASVRRSSSFRPAHSDQPERASTASTIACTDGA